MNEGNSKEKAQHQIPREEAEQVAYTSVSTSIMKYNPDLCSKTQKFLYGYKVLVSVGKWLKVQREKLQAWAQNDVSALQPNYLT